MSRLIAAAGLAALLAAAAGAGTVEGEWSSKLAVASTAERVISSWPDLARSAARNMMAKYGKPDEVGEDALVWYGNGPWKKSIVHRRAWPHYSYMKDKDYLENTIGYAVPNDKLEDLTRFDKKLDVDQASAELSSRSDSEAMNYLALNLADEIVKGKRTVDEAREFAKKSARLMAAGKSSPYLNGFQFDVHNDASFNPWSRR